MGETGETNVIVAVPAQAPRSPLALRPWMGCVSSLLLAMLCLCPSWALLWLGLRGEMVLHAGEPGEVRVWVVRTPEDSALALAVSTMRDVSVTPGQECLQTRVRFFSLALSPAPAPTVYCSCPAGDGGPTFQRGACVP
jgi:hypothetical protein